jgi:caspase domain-containing protein
MVGHLDLRRAWLGLALLPLPVLALMGSSAARANENYALIVSASDYPNLPQRYWLKGPKNDAALVRDYLLHNAPVPFQSQNVTTLGSGAGMELATHQRILDDLGRLAQEAKAGDFVFVQFSGHGSQQPALNDQTEQDGKDEVFLSADTSMAPPDNPTFAPNVLTDDEMAAALTAIRKTGASVWVIFDSCHSGTMTRGAPDNSGLVMREIKPEDLGIAPSAFKLSAKAAASQDEVARSAPLSPDVYGDNAADASEGPLVAFFAAQTNELAPETAFDVAGADGTSTQENFGVFTHAIFSALAKNPNLTYRQLAQSVLASYVADNWLRTTPLFEGKLDAQVFGNKDVVPTEQWPVIVDSNGGLGISAGQLQGLSAGSKLLVVPDPAAANDRALGVVQVASTTELRSTIVPDADAARPELDPSSVPPGAYARLEEVNYPFELKVARPDSNGADPKQVAAVNAALDAIAAQANKPLKLEVVAAGEAADLKLAVMSEQTVSKLAGGSAGSGDTGSLSDSAKLWLLPATGEISLDPGKRPPAMGLAGATAGGGKDFTKNLEETLTTIFRATGLSRLTTANTFAPGDFTLTFSRQEAGSDALAPMVIEQTPVIRPNDRLYVDFTNSSGKPVDLNLLYIDHDYGITPLCAAHLAAGDHLFQPFADIQDSDQGSERLIAVINESGKELTDLSFLAQPGLGGLRGAGQQGLLGMIADLGAGVSTRAAPVMSRDPNVPRGAVVMMPLEALPGTGAAPAAGIPPRNAPQTEGVCRL